MPIANLFAEELKSGKLTYRTVCERALHYRSLQPPTLDHMRVHVTIFYGEKTVGRFVFDQNAGPLDIKYIEEQICNGRYTE